MSQTLYEEAIAEARRLTEMAEQNAKNKIIEAVTPQIRMLIERELMSDADEVEEADEVDEMEDEAVGDVEAADVATLDLDALTPAAQGSAAAPGASVKMTDGTVEVNVDGVKIEVEPSVSHDDEVLLDQTVSETLARLMTGGKKRNKLHERVNKLRINVAVLKKAVNEAKAVGTADQKRAVANIFETLAREAVTLQNQVILTHENTGGRTLETKIVSSIIKEMKDMSRRNNKNAFDFLFEAEEGEDMGTTADAAGGADAGAVEDAVKSLLKAAGIDMDVEVSPAGGEEASEGGEEEADEADEVAEADEMGVHDEAYEADEAMMHEADEEEEEEASKKAMKEADDETAKKEDEVYEIDESALRAELRRLRGLNESDAVEGSGASSFGGGKAGDDMFVDVDEESLLNALADELGTAKMPKVGKMKESTEVAALRRQVQDYKSVAEQLKKQLVEMNLFNAKLLYANKLMQNREITAKQQRAIVEALDNAKTLREAKLLYKSLTTSLNKAANKGNLAEGRDLRTLGSASKSARSAQPAPAAINESGSMDRWALLAGIKKD
jgi:hypothetical protein